MCGFDDELYHSNYHQIIYLCEVIYIPIIAISNVLIIVSISLVARFHTPDNVLLVVLAMVDFSIGVVVIPMTILKNNLATRDVLMENKFFCISHYVITYSLPISSLSILTLVVVFKSISINRPFWYNKHMDNQVAKIVCIAVVGFNFTIIIPLNFHAFKYVDNLSTDTNTDKHIPCSESNIPRWFIFGVLYIYSSAQLLLSCVLCVQIAIKAKKMTTTRNTDIKSNLVISLLFLFIILWLPTVMQNRLITSSWTPMACSHWGFFATQMRYFNSFVNALAYGVFNKHQRYAFRYLMTSPPWKWKGLRDYMLQRDKKEVMRQYVRAIICTSPSVEVPAVQVACPTPTVSDSESSLDSNC